MSLYRILVLTLKKKKKVSLLISNMMPLLASHLPHVWLSVLMFAKTSPIFLHHYIPGNQEIQQNNTWMFKAHHIWKGSFSQLLHLISCQPFWVKMATWTCKVNISASVEEWASSWSPSYPARLNVAWQSFQHSISLNDEHWQRGWSSHQFGSTFSANRTIQPAWLIVLTVTNQVELRLMISLK